MQDGIVRLVDQKGFNAPRILSVRTAPTRYYGFTDNDLPMESNIRMVPRRPIGFEQLGFLEPEFVQEIHNKEGDQRADLHLFVQSLSK